MKGQGISREKGWLFVLFPPLSSTCRCVLGQETIKFGVFGPMTGPAAETGLAIKHSSELAMEEINAKGGIWAKKIECIWGDDESKPEVGVSLYEKFVTRDKVNLVIGGAPQLCRNRHDGTGLQI